MHKMQQLFKFINGYLFTYCLLVVQVVSIVTLQGSIGNRDSVQVDVCHITQVFFQHKAECCAALSAVVRHFATSWTVATAAE